jgi:hypothetical protein
MEETFEPCSDDHVQEILALDASAHSDWSALSTVTDEEGNTIEVFRQRVRNESIESKMSSEI